VKITRVTDHLVQLTRLRAVNAYLVHEDDGLTVVDTLIAGSADGILSAATATSLPVRRILITHGHDDHTGSLDALVQRLDEVEVIVPAIDDALMRGERVPGVAKARIAHNVTTPATQRLTPGEQVGSLEAVATPGHSPGHMSFLDTRDRSVICGDAYLTLGGLDIPTSLRSRFPLPATATWDKARTRESAAALRDLEPTLLAPGHGRVLPDPVREMDRLLARRG
jgi:glyoxylase-like metal-dependent hydrolase (beta-lactamase superfamily II)